MFPLIIVAVSLAGVQILFLLSFLFTFMKLGKITASPSPPVPVSVVIAAHDEEHNLKELIPLLLQQEYPEFEIIIVEDRCNDGTYDYLLQATGQFPNLKMVRVVNKPEHIQGKKFALTLGIKAAQHQWILFTDADCRPTGKHWIARMMQSRLEQTQIILGWSPYKKLPGLLNAFIRFESILTAIQFMSFARWGHPYMGVGRNLAYTKSLFLENKGFPMLEITGGDDDLFVNKYAHGNNTRISLGEESMMVSEPKHTWTQFLQQKLRHLSVGKYYRLSDRLTLGVFMMTWLVSWFLLLPVALVSGSMVAGAFLIARLAIVTTLFWVATAKLGGQLELWKVPFLDFIYAFYYLVTGLRAVVVKKVKWKS